MLRVNTTRYVHILQICIFVSRHLHLGRRAVATANVRTYGNSKEYDVCGPTHEDVNGFHAKDDSRSGWKSFQNHS